VSWKVPYTDLKAQYESLKLEIDHAMKRVMASGRYIGGDEVEEFEDSMAQYLGVKHVIGVGNGYDALHLSFMAVGLSGGFSVLTDRYTHVSTHAAIVNSGAHIIYDESEVDHTTLAYVPVHMNGRVQTLKLNKGPYIIEDACQSLGASFEGQKAGTFGIGCFSLHPLKILSCAGDGGFISTNSDLISSRLRDLRNHGQGNGYGVNSRLDALQAAILKVKLPYLDGWIFRRREIASRYHAELPEWVEKPEPPSDGPYFDTYSSYVIGGSPELLAHLRSQGIECFSHIRTDVVSLPIYPEMKEAHIYMVIEAVKSWRS
jgi:dTDP-4-amino-4,6-dideoxygalactose transaminase